MAKSRDQSVKRVLIFGSGDYGNRFLIHTQEDRNKGNLLVVGFLDNDVKIQGCILYNKYPCFSPDEVIGLEYDVVVIANQSGERVRMQMHQQLIELGVLRESIEFYPTDITDIDVDPRIGFVRDFAKFVCEQGIPGNVAECGVNDGAFAQYINRYFFDRKLYLFDTFEGFTTQDIEVERNLNDENFLNGGFNRIGGWNHSVDVVMSKMTYPKQVLIKKGWVPESFADIEDTFCFVNLDMDLYKPMLAATLFFGKG